MFEEHRVFKKPEDENAKIWRYMDFTKFESLMDRKALFFTRVDQLDDKFEGSLSKYVFNKSIEEKATREELLQLNRERKRFSPLYKSQRKEVAINCWHLNEYESVAMWKLHLKSDEGIAIQSTYRKLVDSLDDSDQYHLWVGMVKYIDYYNDTIPRDNTLYPYIFKRKSFEHEQELRAVITKNVSAKDYPNQIYVGGKDFLFLPKKGVQIPVNLDVLIERIYVSPTREKWFEELIRSMVRKFELEKKVKKSSLADDPMF
jgi:hypothetical protein